MKRFDKKGMMVIPNPIKEKAGQRANVIVLKELYCPNGHNLINSRAKFNGHPGILVKVKQADNQGLVALSPIYGDKSRIALDIDLKTGDIAELICPECDTTLLQYAPCSCGANLVAFFLTRDSHFSDCVGICNRVDCVYSHIIESGEMMSGSMQDIL